MTVFLVHYAGGILGVYDNRPAAEAVVDARNTYAKRNHPRRPVLARVEVWDVQSTPDPKDIE